VVGDIDLQHIDRNPPIMVIVRPTLEALDQLFREGAVAPFFIFQRNLLAGGGGKHHGAILRTGELIDAAGDIQPLLPIPSQRIAGLDAEDRSGGRLASPGRRSGEEKEWQAGCQESAVWHWHGPSECEMEPLARAVLQRRVWILWRIPDEEARHSSGCGGKAFAGQAVDDQTPRSVGGNLSIPDLGILKS